MASKRKRGDVWEYTFKKKGLLDRPLYLRFDDEKEGDRYAKNLQALLDKGIVPVEFQRQAGGLRTLQGAIAEYSRVNRVADSDQDLLHTLEAQVGGTSILSVTYPWVEQWISSMKEVDRLAPQTIRNRAGALSRCLDWLVRHEYLPSNPMKSLPKRYASYSDGSRESVARDRRLEDGEEAAIRLVLAGKLKPDGKQRPVEFRGDRVAMTLLFDLALESAMRMREMYTLDVGQLAFQDRTIYLDRTKNGHKRQVPMTTVIAGLLESYVDEQGLSGGDRLFPWWDGVMGGKEGRRSLKRTTAALSARWATIFEHAGCQDLRFHDLRHEATSRLFERTTLSDTEIAKITGHRDMKMLARYANLRGSNLAERLW